ncbi:MAG: N-acetylglucosamine-6-phosphate deacetylase [Anaerolineae bacterium]
MDPIPGFVDLQVNGFGGIDFSGADLTRDDLDGAFHALLGRGTAGFLPTMITSPMDVYRRNIPLIATMIESDAFRGRVLGLHLEGPFISSAPGAVGAHNPEFVQEPDPATLCELLNLGRGHVRMLTVAAELEGVETLVRLARARGVAVSIGHSLFTMEDLDRMHAAGARSLTHLGNGLPNLLPRHPNPMWDGLAHDGFTAMVIADGHHLPASVIKTMARAKGAQRLIVVSDASPVAGLAPGEYQVLGNRAVLEPSGRLHNPDKQCLVGSSATMLECMNFLASLDIFGPEEMSDVGLRNPLGLIGLSTEDLRAGDSTVSFAQGQFQLRRANCGTHTA